MRKPRRDIEQRLKDARKKVEELSSEISAKVGTDHIYMLIPESELIERCGEEWERVKDEGWVNYLRQVYLPNQSDIEVMRLIGDLLENPINTDFESVDAAIEFYNSLLIK